MSDPSRKLELDLEGDVVLPSHGRPWAAGERDLWIDLFQGYSDALIASSIEDHQGLSHNYPVAQFREDIRVAGELADAAMGEVQWRFHNHPAHTRRATPRPRQPQPATAPPKGGGRRRGR